MAKVLYIQVSPRSDSFSTEVALAFLDSYRQSRPADQVVTLNLATADLMPFDAPAAKAKYAVINGQEPQDEAGRKWKQVIEVINQLKASDKLVIASPMWNFGVPYRLKQYVDIIAQPGLAFAVDKAGNYTGLITGKPAMLILARGGAYPPGSPMAAYDMQRPYLEMILKFIGFQDIRVLTIEPTLNSGPEVARAKATEAAALARKMAKEF
jgi:FMN-dependent NADH-azoreductase